ncbi:MAG: DUF2723 domain-containing protein [Anaerolineales bacterium]|nr:DUF2723 domain-containing protein [Anaerolineales bacterium]MCB9126936.1 DUF2723 domain-containing protein [Ardenticatenales bacterium]MCB9171481.1 DUF2723 domain-containing protein [Ardenticatenales bacterium]
MQQSLPFKSWSLQRQQTRTLPWTALLAFALPLLLYLFTLAPTIYNLDSAELTTAVATGGIVRATGYPLYLALGKLWVALLPVGDIAYRMNLFSAVCGAGTLLLVERTLQRWGVGTVARLGAVGLLASATYFWALSLIAEVYTLHTVLMMALLLALLHWRERPSATRLAGVGLLVGLGLSHHLATALLLPGVAFFLISSHWRATLRPKSLLSAAGATAVALSCYFYLSYLYLQQPPFNYAGLYDSAGQFQAVDLTTVRGLWWLISGASFSGAMLAYDLAGLWHELGQFALQLWQDFMAVGIGPALLGAGLLLRRDWRLGGLLLLFFVGNGLFYADYRVIDKATMFLPNYVVMALWIGVGLAALLRWVAAEGSDRRGPALLGAMVALTVAASVALHWPLVDRSQDNSTRDNATAILTTAEENALLIGWWDAIPAVEYLQRVEGERPDIQTLNRFLISHESLQTLLHVSLGQRPIYVSELPPVAFHPMRYQPVGDWFRILPTLPPHRENVPLGTP